MGVVVPWGLGIREGGGGFSHRTRCYAFEDCRGPVRRELLRLQAEFVQLECGTDKRLDGWLRRFCLS